jgi:hypothetical protein
MKYRWISVVRQPVFLSYNLNTMTKKPVFLLFGSVYYSVRLAD